MTVFRRRADSRAARGPPRHLHVQQGHVGLLASCASSTRPTARVLGDQGGDKPSMMSMSALHLGVMVWVRASGSATRHRLRAPLRAQLTSSSRGSGLATVPDPQALSMRTDQAAREARSRIEVEHDPGGGDLPRVKKPTPSCLTCRSALVALLQRDVDRGRVRVLADVDERFLCDGLQVAGHSPVVGVQVAGHMRVCSREPSSCTNTASAAASLVGWCATT